MSEDQSEGVIDTPMVMHLFVLTLRAFAIVFEMVLHSGMGVRYPGVAGVAVLVLIPFYMLFWQGDDLRPVVLIWPAFIVMSILRRSSTVIGRMRGVPIEHSMYNGYPILCSLFGLPEQFTKGFIEPVLVGFAGLMCCIWNEPFGFFMLLGATSLFICAALSRRITHAQAYEMHDAIINQQHAIERFRKIRGH